MAKFRVVVTDLGYKSYAPEEEAFTGLGLDVELVLRESGTPLAEACAGAHGLLVRQSEIDRPLLESMKGCRVVARYGIGVDNVDLAAATECGIVVANTPGFCVHEVAEHALALVLACARRVLEHDRRVRAGEWDIGSKAPIYRIEGKTLGLVGLGAIPQKLAAKAGGLGLRMIAADPYVKPEIAARLHVELVGFDRLLAESDFVSIHAPNLPETRHMFNADAFTQMKPTAYLVNTSRGPLVDEAALAAALERGEIAGAALDVFETEPLPADSPLRESGNLILSDHAGWYSEESILEVQRRAGEAVASVLAGKRPESVVNPDVYKKIGEPRG